MLSEDDGFEKTELDDYLAEKLLPNEEDILAIPISTFASESAFSMSGNRVTKQRNRLKPETVGALMCSQSKKQGEPKAFDQTVAYDDDVE
ncbi:unnamed protein product [Lactuca saligna]|uniref:HAT C-terminal dimerisation domain-containing protein n=1 Tax=Lactuca saligna TaxID=75948 RepID=A0AA36E7V1_LACSI|nr:unnamed protein product [Lactuca saligna]